MHIPLVDCDQAKRAPEAIAGEIDAALRSCGFLVATGLGLPPAAQEEILYVAAEFFACKRQVKARCAYRSAEENFGYQGVGVESLDPKRPADLKESFTMRNILAAPVEDSRWPNLSFRRSVSGFYAAAFLAAQRLQRLLALALEVPEEFFVACHSGENVTLRLLHYPPVPAEAVAEQQMGAGAHTDYGMLTLLLQDTVGGLQVRDEAGSWHDVPPCPGTIVVNSGDLLERWSNGRYRSTWHRVLPRGVNQDRYSVAFFVDPDSATEVRALPSCTGPGQAPRFPPTTAGEHLTAKILATHGAPGRG